MGCLFQNHIFIYMRCYIYLHRRLDNNEVFYIGRGTVNKKASGKCDTNTFSRAYQKHSHNIYWLRLTKKTPCSVEIIEDFLSWDMSIVLEKKYIKEYGRKNIKEGTLINLTDGGEGTLGLVTSELSILTQRKRMLSEMNPMKNNNNRIKQSLRMKNNNPMKNIETKNKVVKKLKDLWVNGTENHPRKGKSREDLRLRNLTNNPAKNPNVIEKLRQIALNRNNKGGNSPNAKKVKHLETGKIYNSIIECQKDLNISHTSIYRYLKNGKIVYL